MPRRYFISDDLDRYYFLLTYPEHEGSIKISVDAHNEEDALKKVYEKIHLEKKKFFKIY